MRVAPWIGALCHRATARIEVTGEQELDSRGPERGVRHAQERETARPEHASDLPYHQGRIDQMLQHLQTDDDVEAGIVIWQRVRERRDLRFHATLPGGFDRDLGDVDAVD